MSQPSRGLLRIIGRTRITTIHGGIYTGPSRYQDRKYQRCVDRLMAERTAKTVKAASA